MKTHAIGQGPPPEGAQAPALCGNLQKGDFLTRAHGMVSCPECLKILSKR